MYAKTITEAKELFIGAVARLLLDNQITFISSSDSASPTELRTSAEDREIARFSRTGKLKVEPYSPVDAFRIGDVSGYADRQDYRRKVDIFNPPFFKDLECLVEKAKAKVKKATWKPQLPEPDANKVREGAARLVGALGIDMDVALDISYNFWLSEQHLQSFSSHIAPIQTVGRDKGYIFKYRHLVEFDLEQLRALDLENVFIVDIDDTETRTTQDLRTEILIRFAAELGIDNFIVDTDRPHETVVVANAPEGRQAHITDVIAGLVSNRADIYVSTQTIAKFEAAQAFYDAVRSITPKSFHHGDFINASLGLETVAGR